MSNLKTPLPKEICVILTYRCNAKCNMCDVWRNPSRAAEEITARDLERLPSGFRFINITGGEPFVRRDLPEIVDVLRPKTKRIVISTNGFFTDRIVALCKEYPDLGIRISIEGLQETNDAIRGIPDGFDRTIRTLTTLREMGVKDIGFGMTVQDMNAKDLIPLYELADSMNYEFATATLHNSHYFHKLDNRVQDPDRVSDQFRKLIVELLKSSSIKKWFRAYFNYGLIHYLNGNRRLLPCEMAIESCFLDPWGDVLPCNGMDTKVPMGNIREETFEKIWNSEKAESVRQRVRSCDKQCWMVGSAIPVMKKYVHKPAFWVVKNKLRVMLGMEPDIHLRNGKLDS
jgi:MoaA/NifB/PqqE/SkfB family radical SAM enzyme